MQPISESKLNCQRTLRSHDMRRFQSQCLCKYVTRTDFVSQEILASRPGGCYRRPYLPPSGSPAMHASLAAALVLLLSGPALAADAPFSNHPINQWVLQSPRDGKPAPNFPYEGSGA